MYMHIHLICRIYIYIYVCMYIYYIYIYTYIHTYIHTHTYIRHNKPNASLNALNFEQECASHPKHIFVSTTMCSIFTNSSTKYS